MLPAATTGAGRPLPIVTWTLGINVYTSFLRTRITCLETLCVVPVKPNRGENNRWTWRLTRITHGRCMPDASYYSQTLISLILLHWLATESVSWFWLEYREGGYLEQRPRAGTHDFACVHACSLLGRPNPCWTSRIPVQKHRPLDRSPRAHMSAQLSNLARSIAKLASCVIWSLARSDSRFSS
jgi:hypothetical protein